MTATSMTATIVTTKPIAPSIHYPSGDGQPLAETFDHVYVILVTIAVLRHYFRAEQVCVLGNQFLYYAQGFPKLRCAPDVMVIFGVEPGSRDNYKIWEEGEVPRVVFEMTSPGTKKEDDGSKKQLYEQLGIQEYWQFDPRGEWIPEKLRGYQLVGDDYQPIESGISQAMGLRLEPHGAIISFYQLDTGEKLLIMDELYAQSEDRKAELMEERLQLRQTEAELMAQRSTTEDLQQQLDRYREQFGELLDES